MSILFPVVPIAPGVPAVFRAVAFTVALAQQAPIDIATSDDVPDDFDGPQWGIFDADLNPVITGDSTVRVGYVHEFAISDYPVEDGGFESYNRVQKPFEARLSFVQGGSIGDVSDFLSSVEDTLKSLDLFTVVTPEASYPSVSLMHMDYDRRADKGAQLLPVDIWTREIRIAPAPAFTNTASPQGSSTQAAGQVQAQAPTTAQAAAATPAQGS